MIFDIFRELPFGFCHNLTVAKNALKIIICRTGSLKVLASSTVIWKIALSPIVFSLIPDVHVPADPRRS
jgi:hypothetical protein